MKKAIIFFIAISLVASVTSVAFSRTMAQEAQAVRDYIKVLDAKLAKAKKAKQPAKVKQLQDIKKKTLLRWNKMKTSMAPAPAAPRVVRVPPPPPPRIVKKAPAAGLLKMGLDCSVAGDYINTGSGQLGGSLGLSGSIMFSDPLALGAKVGLSAKAARYTVGFGYYQGGGGLKAIPISFGGIVMLPVDLMGAPLFVKGGLNYVAYGNGQKPGKLGGDVSVGVMADLGLGLGKTAFALGYAVVRSDTVSAKGLSFTVSQPFVL